MRNAEGGVPYTLLPAESRLCLLNRLSELASGNEIWGQGYIVPLQGLGQSPSRIQGQSPWRVKGRALV